MNLLALLLGRRLANRESGARKIGALEGVPAMGLDALASVAYGPEAALMLLMPFGAAAPAMLGWLLLPIIVLLGLLCLSYWQTIQVYRERGGAYVVAREYLGAPAGMVAAETTLLAAVSGVRSRITVSANGIPNWRSTTQGRSDQDEKHLFPMKSWNSGLIAPTACLPKPDQGPGGPPTGLAPRPAGR